jgi:hypothetical protein
VEAYLRAFATVVKVAFKFVPTVWTTTTMATEMPAAIRPYSIAVAPDWSLRKLAISDMVEALLVDG